MVAMLYVQNTVNDSLQASDALGAIEKSRMQQTTDKLPARFDNMILVAISGLWIGLIIAAAYIDVDSPFMAIFLVITIFLLVGMAYLGNAIESAITSAFPADILSLSLGYFIITHTLELAILMILSILGVTYLKTRS